MKRIFVFFLVFLGVNFMAQNDSFQPKHGITNKYLPTYALTNATIHISSKEIIKKGTLLIKGTKIISVGKDVNIPKNSIVLNMDGKHIYHSFIELNSQLGIKKENRKKRSSKPQYYTSKPGPFHWNEAIRPEYNSENHYMYNNIESKGYIKKGFGVVLTHNQNGIIRGTGTLVCLSNKKEKQILKGSSATFFSFNKGTSNQVYPRSLMGSIALLRQFFIDANWYENSTKTTKNLSYEAYIEQKSFPKVFSIDYKRDLFRAQKIADEYNLSFIYKGTGREYENIKQIININPSLIIPLNFPRAMDVSDPYVSMKVSTNDLTHWKYAASNLALLEKENLNFCITSDTLNFKDFFNNLSLAVNRGLSYDKAYYSLTEGPAKLLGIDGFCGTIKEGNLANILVSNDTLFKNKTIIYENWVLGERTILKKKPINDLRGSYNLNINQNIRKLVVKGEINKPKAIIIYNIISDSISKNGDIVTDSLTKKGIKVKKEIKQPVNIQRSENIITLSFPLTDNFLTLSGTINFDSGSWDGAGQSKDGTWFKWSAIRNKKHIAKIINSNAFIDTTKVFISNQHIDYLPKNSLNAGNVVFKNATIWTVDEMGTFKGDLWIKDGIIKDLGLQINITDTNQLKIIDATNKHISPGIIDEHSHIAIERGVNEGSHAITSEVRIGDVINPEDINIYRQLAGGVTSAQLLHGSANPIGGQSAVIKLRWGSTAEEMKIAEAPGFIKFALGENVKQSNWGYSYNIRYPQTRMGVEQLYYDAFIRAKEYEIKWKKYLALDKKKQIKKSAPKKDIQLDALVEIMNQKRFITCHSYVQSEINMLMHMADSMGFKINTFTHILEGYKVADKMKTHGAGGSTFSDWWAYKYEVRDAIPYNACLLSQMGIITAVNSDDAEMARRLNQEAAKAVKYGDCSEEDALKLVTINPAKLLHIDDKVGSLKVNKEADIVLWSDNPLSIYSIVEQTYVDGKLLFDRKQNKIDEKELIKVRAEIISDMISAKNNGNPIGPLKKQNNSVHKCNQTIEIED
ncbi:MAG: amidohydrolase [Crocinitomicaceae bacterium]|nr:amidohydrolase [Crocinitomicaceae bacterium]|tara:strand:- start:5454 stop:8528 length:3075 start_codon:yes stop_codon:yes gene_type:complete